MLKFIFRKSSGARFYAQGDVFPKLAREKTLAGIPRIIMDHKDVNIALISEFKCVPRVH